MGLSVFCSSLEELDKREGQVLVPTNLSRVVTTGSNVLPHPSSTLANLARNVLFRSSHELSGKVGDIHPFFKRGVPHPANLDGMDKVIGRLCLGRIKPVKKLMLEERGSALIFGGPVSSLEARLLFGPLLGAALPVSFQYADKLDEATATRTEPWELLIDGIPARGLEDALVITALPVDQKDWLIDVAGVRAPGTLAIDLVLRDEPMLDQLYRQTRHLQGWQAVAEVVLDDSKTAPVSVRNLTVRELDSIDFESISYLEMVRVLRGKGANLDQLVNRISGRSEIGQALRLPSDAALRSRTAAHAPLEEQQSMNRDELDRLLALVFDPHRPWRPLAAEELKSLRIGSSKQVKHDLDEYIASHGRPLNAKDRARFLEAAFRILK